MKTFENLPDTSDNLLTDFNKVLVDLFKGDNPINNGKLYRDLQFENMSEITRIRNSRIKDKRINMKDKIYNIIDEKYKSFSPKVSSDRGINAGGLSSQYFDNVINEFKFFMIKSDSNDNSNLYNSNISKLNSSKANNFFNEVLKNYLDNEIFKNKNEPLFYETPLVADLKK